MVEDPTLTPEQQAEQARRDEAFEQDRAANAPTKYKSPKKAAAARKNLEQARASKKEQAIAKKHQEMAEAKRKPRKPSSDDEEEEPEVAVAVEDEVEDESSEEELEELELRPVRRRGASPRLQIPQATQQRTKM